MTNDVIWYSSYPKLCIIQLHHPKYTGLVSYQYRSDHWAGERCLDWGVTQLCIHLTRYWCWPPGEKPFSSSKTNYASLLLPLSLVTSLYISYLKHFTKDVRLRLRVETQRQRQSKVEKPLVANEDKDELQDVGIRNYKLIIELEQEFWIPPHQNQSLDRWKPLILFIVVFPCCEIVEWEVVKIFSIGNPRYPFTGLDTDYGLQTFYSLIPVIKWSTYNLQSMEHS